MLDRVVEHAREQELCSRDDTPTEERVLEAVLYQAGVSYRDVGAGVGVAHETVRKWYLQLAHLFDPEPDSRSTVAVG